MSKQTIKLCTVILLGFSSVACSSLWEKQSLIKNRQFDYLTAQNQPALTLPPDVVLTGAVPYAPIPPARIDRTLTKAEVEYLLLPPGNLKPAKTISPASATSKVQIAEPVLIGSLVAPATASDEPQSTETNDHETGMMVGGDTPTSSEVNSEPYVEQPVVQTRTKPAAVAPAPVQEPEPVVPVEPPVSEPDINSNVNVETAPVIPAAPEPAPVEEVPAETPEVPDASLAPESDEAYMETSVEDEMYGDLNDAGADESGDAQASQDTTDAAPDNSDATAPESKSQPAFW